MRNKIEYWIQKITLKDFVKVNGPSTSADTKNHTEEFEPSIVHKIRMIFNKPTSKYSNHAREVHTRWLPPEHEVLDIVKSQIKRKKPNLCEKRWWLLKRIKSTISSILRCISYHSSHFQHQHGRGLVDMEISMEFLFIYTWK